MRKPKLVENKYPEGKLNENDEGALTFGIGIEGGNIIIKFPKSVAWIGFPPVFARQLAKILIEKANIIENCH